MTSRSAALPDQRRRASRRQRGNGRAAAADQPPSTAPEQPAEHHQNHYHHREQQRQQQKEAMLSTLDRVSLTECVWNLGRVTRAAAVHALRNSADGAFVVRTADVTGSGRDHSMTSSVLHVRCGTDVRQVPVHVTRQGHLRLADGDDAFSSLSDLVAYYCDPRRNNGLRLVLPDAIKTAKTRDELRAMAQISAEFWLSAPPPVSTSTSAMATRCYQSAVKSTSHHVTSRQTDVKLSSSTVAGRTADNVALASNHLVQRSTSAVTSSVTSGRQNVEDKLSDYEDLWSPTVLPHGPPQPSRRLDPRPTGTTYSAQTMPSSSGRQQQCVLDPSKYQLPGQGHAAAAVEQSVTATVVSDVRRSSPSVFRFDRLRPPPAPCIGQRGVQQADETGPSPIYVEPCDGLAPGLRQRVAVVRRSRATTSTMSSVTASTPPISASYKLPHDFLQSLGPGPDADLQGFNRPTSPPRGTSTPQNVASPPSTLDNPAVVVSPAEFSSWCSGDVDDRRQQAGIRACEAGDRLRVSSVSAKAAAAAVAMRGQRRSNYDNISNDEYEEATEPRSRHMTVSSVQTEYSPPWDTADRWRLIVAKTDPRLWGSGGGSGEPATNGDEFCACDPPDVRDPADVDELDDEFVYSELESAASTIDKFFGMRTPPPPAPPPPRCGSLAVGGGGDDWGCRQGRGTWSRSGSICTGGHGTTTARQTPPHQPLTTTMMSDRSTVMSTLNPNFVNKNFTYRHRSPDVIPSLSGPKIISARNRGHQFPGAKIGDFIIELANRKPEHAFGAFVRNFVQCTLNGSERNPQTVLSNIRQFMNGMKNYLSHGTEPELDNFIQAFRAKMLPSEFLNLDAVMERAMIRCVVKPLKEHIYRLFTYDLTRNGSLQLLCDGLKLIRTASPESIGVQPELLTSSDEVSHFLVQMEKTCSPLKKLENLLGAMTALSNSILVQYQETGYRVAQSSVSADDLLSALIVILAQQNLQSSEIEASYMWGLTDHSFLVGDSRYFLMTFSSAVDRLKAVRKSVENMTLGYRTLNGTKPADQEGYITVVTPDESRDILVKHSLPVRQSVNVNDVCCMLAHRLRITNPQDYGLYTLKASPGAATLLGSNELISPSRSCKDISQVGFIYKRINAYFVWSPNIGV